MLGENWPDKLQDSKGVNCSKLREHWEHSEAVNKRLKEDRREEAADQGQETPKETSNEGSESKVQEPLRRYLEWLKPMALFLWLGIGIQERRITDIEQALGCVGYKDEDVSELHYRARYNLACCHSALGETLDARKKRKEAYEKSREHLNHALERGGDIVQWAQKDPSLRGVQEFERRQKAKKKCVTGIKDTIARIWK
jgi:hypothetical protein